LESEDDIDALSSPGGSRSGIINNMNKDLDLDDTREGFLKTKR
jgi:hypothetical protein